VLKHFKRLTDGKVVSERGEWRVLRPGEVYKGRQKDQENEARHLCKVLPEWIGPQQDLNALFPRVRVPSPKLRAFLHYLKAELRFTHTA
jgi:hypothetical protein